MARLIDFARLHAENNSVIFEERSRDSSEGTTTRAFSEKFRVFNGTTKTALGIRSVETPNRQRTGHLTAPASDTDILVNDRIAKTFFVLAHSYSIDGTNGCTCLAAAAICLTPGLKKARPKIRLGYFYRHSAPKSRRPPRR